MPSPSLQRRALLTGTVSALALATGSAGARTIHGALPWSPDAATAPDAVRPGAWVFFTAEEGAAVEAIVDRIFPPDPKTPGGKDAGCALFIDRQLAGPYGRSEGLYMRPPFLEATPSQGLQSPLRPAGRYRGALAALDVHCRATFVGKTFAGLGADQQDKVLAGLETGTARLEGADGRAFFEIVLTNTQEGFFADPIYGGNRDMAGWRMLGFPGVRYDYRDWVSRHGEAYTLPPVGIAGRPEWLRAG